MLEDLTDNLVYSSAHDLDNGSEKLLMSADIAVKASTERRMANAEILHGVSR